MKVIKEGNVLTIERIIDASKDKVWEAWTTPDIFSEWWGPKGWKTTVKEFDFKEGGQILYEMKCEDETQEEWYGKTSWSKAVYKTIQPEDAFTYTDYFSDEEGNAIEGMPVINVEMAFEEVDGKTKMTDVSTYESEAALAQVLEMGMEQGVKETWDRLERLLQRTS